MLSLIESPITALALALFLGALAASGKTSQSLANWFLGGVFVLGTIAIWRAGVKDARLLAGSALGVGSLCLFVSYWINPSAKPVEQFVAPKPRITVTLRQMVLDSASLPTAVRIFIQNSGDQIEAEATDIVSLVPRSAYSRTHPQTQLEQELWNSMQRDAIWKPLVVPAKETGGLLVDAMARNRRFLDPETGAEATQDHVRQRIRNGDLLYFLGMIRDKNSKETLVEFCFYYSHDYPGVWNLCSAGYNASY